MKLVLSNDPDTLQKTVRKAIKVYQDKSDVSAALGILTQLKGIGPATASLLLAVHDEENVIFFADEAFYWLCCGGSKSPIKYTLKEYIALHERAQTVIKRLGVKAVDVERVAFVLMKQSQSKQDQGTPAAARVKQDKGKQEAKPPAKEDIKKQPAKRKIPADESEINTGLRRSKRGK